MQFLWTTIHVNDIDISKKFYCEVVGLKVQREIQSSGMSIVFLGGGETQVELICDPDGEAQTGTGQISIGFLVEDVGVKRNEIKVIGDYQYTEVIQPNPNIRFFYVNDPNGVKVQFVEIIN